MDIFLRWINDTSGRRLNKELITRFATCEYISEHWNLFITGATGSGKTYMACAFGIEACKQYSNLLIHILDEWLLLKPTDSEQRNIFELLHRRCKKISTIFCSQYEFEEWYEQLGGDASPSDDAIIDRIIHASYRINITSIDAEHDISM